MILSPTTVFTRQARRLGRRYALQTATASLLLAYGGAAVVFAAPSQLVDSTWVRRADYWPSLALAGLTLLGGAALSGGWAGAAIGRRPGRAGWVGAAGGVLLLLAATLVGSGWNAGQHALRFMPFPGTTAADFNQHVQDTLLDYVGKPLAWVMPLGSVVAGLLGAWTGRRIRAGLAAWPLHNSVAASDPAR